MGVECREGRVGEQNEIRVRRAGIRVRQVRHSLPGASSNNTVPCAPHFPHPCSSPEGRCVSLNQ